MTKFMSWLSRFTSNLVIALVACAFVSSAGAPRWGVIATAGIVFVACVLADYTISTIRTDLRRALAEKDGK